MMLILYKIEDFIVINKQLFVHRDDHHLHPLHFLFSLIHHEHEYFSNLQRILSRSQLLLDSMLIFIYHFQGMFCCIDLIITYLKFQGISL